MTPSGGALSSQRELNTRRRHFWGCGMMKMLNSLILMNGWSRGAGDNAMNSYSFDDPSQMNP